MNAFALYMWWGGDKVTFDYTSQLSRAMNALQAD